MLFSFVWKSMRRYYAQNKNYFFHRSRAKNFRSLLAPSGADQVGNFGFLYIPPSTASFWNVPFVGCVNSVTCALVKSHLFTHFRSHANESADVAHASTAERYVRRRLVMVIRDFRLARFDLYADGLARQALAGLAVTHLGARAVFQAVKLK